MFSFRILTFNSTETSKNYSKKSIEEFLISTEFKKLIEKIKNIELFIKDLN
jgi:hypothetical protein